MARATLVERLDLSCDLGAPSFLDTCLVQFLLSDLIVNGRQHAVIRVLALRVAELLDVFEHVSPRIVAGRICPSPDLLPLQQLKEAFCNGIVMAVSARAPARFQIVLMYKRLPLPPGEL